MEFDPVLAEKWAVELDDDVWHTEAAVMLRAAIRKVAELKRDLESLNQMVRETTGEGQGGINAYAEQCVELDETKSLLARYETVYGKTEAVPP